MTIYNHEIVRVYQLSDINGELYWACMQLLGVGEDYLTFNELCKRCQELGYEIVTIIYEPFEEDAVLKDYYKMLVRYK